MKRANLDDIIDFLKVSYPTAECILIGCWAQADFESYDCCEYDIIVLESDDGNNIDFKNKRNQLIQFHKKKLEVSLYSNKSFILSKDILFQDYFLLTNSFSANNIYNYFGKKNTFVKENLKIFCKRKLLQLALFNTQINKQLLNKDKFDQNLSLFNLRMLSIEVLEVMIQLFGNRIPSPSHLKYQINLVKDFNPKLKESIDFVLELIEVDRSNISTIKRSEKSLFFFMKNIKSNYMQLELLTEKLHFFKSKSMYVDGNLLIHSFIKNNYFNYNHEQNYNKLLNYVLDIQYKDKIRLFKELELLFNIIKNLIRNSY